MQRSNEPPRRLQILITFDLDLQQASHLLRALNKLAQESA